MVSSGVKNIQDDHPHGNCHFAQFAFAFRAVCKSSTSLHLLFLILLFTLPNARIHPRRYRDGGCKPQNGEQAVNDNKGIGISESFGSLEDGYGGLVDQSQYTEPALVLMLVFRHTAPMDIQNTHERKEVFGPPVCLAGFGEDTNGHRPGQED